LVLVVCALQTIETPSVIKIPAILSNFIIDNLVVLKKNI